MSPNYLLRISAQGGLPDDMLRMLEDGAEINHEDLSGVPALHLACLGGNIQCIHIALEAGADIDAENSKGMTAVQVSMEEGRFTSVACLLDQNADGSMPWPDGRNLLHWSVMSGQDRLIARSVRQGANINALNRMGKTPVNLAAELGQVACLKALLECGANPLHIKHQPLTPEISLIVSAWRARKASEDAFV